MQQGGDLGQLFVAQGGLAAQKAGLELHAVFGHALDTANRQATVARNVGGFGGPRRHRAQTRRDDDGRAIGRAGSTRVGVAIVQQRGQTLVLGGRGRVVGAHQVNKAGADAGDFRVDSDKRRLQLLGAKGAEGVSARKRG